MIHLLIERNLSMKNVFEICFETATVYVLATDVVHPKTL